MRRRPAIFGGCAALIAVSLLTGSGASYGQQPKPTDDDIDRAIRVCSLGTKTDADVKGGLDVLKKRILTGEGSFSYSEIPSVIGAPVGTDDAKLKIFDKIQNCVVSKVYTKAASKYNLTVRSNGPFIDNIKFGPVDGSISTIELLIDGKSLVKSELDEPFGSHSVQLTEGDHAFEFIAEIYGAGNNNAILKDNCSGSFTLTESVTMQPRVKFDRVQLDGVFRDCSLRPM